MKWVDRIFLGTEAPRIDEETPDVVLDALDWSDTDSPQELVERAEKLEQETAAA
jgi:hypothetical protein